MYGKIWRIIYPCLGVLSLLWLSSIVACSGVSPEPCSSNRDCMGDQVCDQQRCVDKCKNDGDCVGTQRCNPSTGLCGTSQAICGNGKLDAGEQCDGNNLNNQTCQTQGFASGNLRCTSSCKFDTSNCSAATTCGNGKLDAGEECDGNELNNQTCQTQGFVSGTLRCNSSCRYDTSDCQKTPNCGNGKIDLHEDCDGNNHNGHTCQSQGFAGGTLGCTSGCRFDTSLCQQASACGNGKLDSGEDCDGNELNNQTCQSLGFSSGTLRCNNGCRFDTSLCQQSSTCGNGKLDAGEECDSNDLNNQTCQTKGYDGGVLRCSRACRFDLSGCTKEPKCGDNKAESSEQCDGTDLKGKTCLDFNFQGGVLRCDNTCKFDTSNCSNTGQKKAFGSLCATNDECTSGLCLRIEQADANGYCSATCSETTPCPSTPPGAQCNLKAGETHLCGWSCTPNVTQCPTGLNCVPLGTSHICAGRPALPPAQCGNNKAEHGEECDGTDLNNQTCQTQGFSGGTLKCNNCKLDTSACTGTPQYPGNIGKPCQSSADCGANNICVSFTSSQAYCTTACSNTTKCPATPDGRLSCSIQLQSGGNVCGWPTSSGGPPICGNGILDYGEDCDGNVLGGTCMSLGYAGGTLKCNRDCTFDASACTGTNKCPNLPERHCKQNCLAILQFTPKSGTGYQVWQADWTRRDVMLFIKYAAAAIDCLYPGTPPLGLGDMSMQGGLIPANSTTKSCQTNANCGDGHECRSGTCWRLHHPLGTHLQGRDIDTAYYQVNTSDNRLRPVCDHCTGSVPYNCNYSSDQYHCVGPAKYLEPNRTALFLAILIETGLARVIGVDGKVGPPLKTAFQTLHQSGMISKYAYDLFNKGVVTWEETNTGRGWFHFHHHHAHVSFR